jgi:hypothetical protein
MVLLLVVVELRQDLWYQVILVEGIVSLLRLALSH